MASLKASEYVGLPCRLLISCARYHHKSFQQLTDPLCPPMRASHKLCHFTVLAHLLYKFRHELRGGGPIPKDDNLLASGLKATVPLGAVECLSSERLRSLDIGNIRAVEGTHGANDDRGFSPEDLAGDSIPECAVPQATTIVPDEADARRIESAVREYVVFLSDG